MTEPDPLAVASGGPPACVMTDDEALAWAKAATWQFDSYYKYSFYFIARGGAITGRAHCGGDSGDIYRFEVTAGRAMPWDEISWRGHTGLSLSGPDGKVTWPG